MHETRIKGGKELRGNILASDADDVVIYSFNVLYSCLKERSKLSRHIWLQQDADTPSAICAQLPAPFHGCATLQLPCPAPSFSECILSASAARVALSLAALRLCEAIIRFRTSSTCHS